MEKRKRNSTKFKATAEEGTTGVELVEKTEVEDLKQALKEKEDQLLRTLAEFDNYRKRIGKESDDIGKAGKRELLLGLLRLAIDSRKERSSKKFKRGIGGKGRCYGQHRFSSPSPIIHPRARKWLNPLYRDPNRFFVDFLFGFQFI